MVFISDQFEVEMLDQYSGSYTDGIFTPGNIFDGTRKVYMSNANPDATSSLKEGFRVSSLTKLAPMFGRGLQLGLTDLNFTDGFTNFFIPVVGSSVLPVENIPSPSKNLLVKLFSSDERLADTVLPRPPDIALTNGAIFSEGVGEYMFPNGQRATGFLLFPPASVLDLLPASGAVPRTPKMFNITLGSHEVRFRSTAASPDTISDQIWYASFPFENKYSHLKRLTTPSFDKKYLVTLSQSLTGFVSPTFAVFTGGLDMQASVLDEPFETPFYTLQYVFDTRKLVAPYTSRRRFITLVKTPISVSNGIFKPIFNNSHPDINFIYKGFFGFYKNLNDESPYKSSLDGEGVPPWKTGLPGAPASGYPTPNALSLIGDGGAHVVKSIRFNGFGRFNKNLELLNGGRFPINSKCNGWSPDGGYELTSSGNIRTTVGVVSHYSVMDFNNFYLKITGWKYGIYSADPTNSSAIWRRSRYGQFRDQLEQRLDTKFYKKDTAQSSPIGITFISGSDAYVTASNPALNTLDSGIYDREGKSGRPFDDREAID